MTKHLRSVLQAFTTCLSLLAAAPPVLALFAAVLILGAMPGWAADPVVSNLKAVQRAGTKLVDITYDLAADTPTVQVSLQISGDGGATFAVPAVSVTGAVGLGVSTGAGKLLTWNAGADWNWQFSSRVRFKVAADDLVAPAGFASIPAGNFSMGDSLDGIADAPVHQVNVSGFYMGKTEVTKGEWDEVRAWAAVHGYTDLSAGGGAVATHPVRAVTWWDTIKWCNARSEKEGLTPCYAVGGGPMRTGTIVPTVNWMAKGYRLPTEAEWEKAARGGLSGKRFPWGDTISQSQANYYSSNTLAYDVSPTRGYHPIYGGGAAPAGSFAANGYGLHDMAGNAWEWCWDWYGAYAVGGQSDPKGATSGTMRVFRDGRWDGGATDCRAAFRSSISPNYQDYPLGFRSARSSVPSTTATIADLAVDTRDPVVSNLKAVQRAGTKLVDITYDLAADAATVAVSLQISWDGGATFAVPAVSVTGSVGSGVSTGTGKALTWDAGADWNEQFSSQVRVKVVVDDGVAAAGLVAIPTGLFMMGDSLDGYASAPVHEVAVRAIYVAKTEVTKAQWDLVRGWAVGRGYTSLHAGAGKSRDHPIQSIEWYQCLLYCNARSEQEGLMPVYYTDESQTKVYRSGNLDLSNVQVKWNANGYRLPTEAEWEKAARGGLNGKRFPWGDTISHSQANYSSSSDWAYDVSPTRGYHPSTVAGGDPPTLPVGSFAANGYGLYDMAGNVFEWCWDRYGSYAGAAVDPRGPDVGANRVIRGSSCRAQANGCRNADRYQNGGGLRSDNLGFRVLRSSVPSTTATTSDLSVDTRDPVAWTLFRAAEAGLAVGDVWLVSLSPLDKLSVVAGGEAHDGAAALKLMAADGAASYAERSIEGPALVSFWWRVSSEKDYDLFSYSVDGVAQESISGEGGWLKRSLSLAAGRHALRWTYRKDAADKNFQDAGFLDEVVIVDAYRNLEVRSEGSVVAGSAALDYGTVKQDDPEVAKAIVFKNTGTVVMPFTASLPSDSGFVFANGQPTSTQSLPAGQEVSLSLVLQTSLAGPKTALLGITAAGSRTDPPAITLSGLIQGPILQVAGSGLVRGSVVNSGTTAAWETATTSLPGGASGATIKTGSTPDNGHSTIGARFDGPGLLRWQWKVSAQKDYDWLICEVNGVEVAGISTKAAAWQSQVIQIPVGAEARWIYRKDASNQSGTDSGYLAEVRFDKFTAAPVSFSDWSVAQGGIAPLDLTGPGKIQGMFAWLGGFDPATGPGEGQYLPTVSGGFYRYRYAISKTAGGQVQPEASSDLASWNSRGQSQTVLSENEATATVELAVPALGKIYTRLKADVPTYAPGMVKVAGGALPADSWAGAQSVDAFYIGKYEVQWGEWQSGRSWALAHGYAINEGGGLGAEYPVMAVSWYDAMKWCNARSEHEGFAPVYTVGGAPYRTGEVIPDVSASANGYRLPSEKEWEFAARGGVATHGYTHSGSNDVDAVAWYGSNAGRASHPVGTKLGNELGLFDLSGNVLEWCFDLFSGSNRVVRGGGWHSDLPYCQAAIRDATDAGARDGILGFRVARKATP